MADPVSSKPWHAVFLFLIMASASVVQMHFPNSSPSDKYSVNLWIFILCLFLYGFSSAYYTSQASTSNNDNPDFKLLSHTSVVSGSMACVALISMLVTSKAALALIIIIYFICLLIYFAPNQITEICNKITSYVYHMGNGTEHNHDNPRDNMEV